MKRRTFILASGIAIVTIPVISYTWSYLNQHDTLSYPDELGRFCDEKSIREIGTKYLSLAPLENKKEKLAELLLTDYSGEKLKISDRSNIIKLLDKKIYKDFSEYKTIIIDGWVISITEARQCALYSLK